MTRELRVAGFFAVCALAAACAVTPQYQRPPIIIVDIDTLRADHLGCYGYERQTSPNIDEFSEQAVRFEWAFAQAPNTPPSQASILTGLYPTTHGRIGNYELLSPEIVTLAEVLQAAGYATAAFVDGGLMMGRYGYDQGFDLYDDEAGHLDQIGPKVRQWLIQRLRSPQPFLLLVHSYDVHPPYEDTPEPHRSMFLDGLPRPSEEFCARVTPSMVEARNRLDEGLPPDLDPEELDWAKALYDGGIHHVDHWFAEFEELLRRGQVLDQAIVVVVSDHGEEFLEHESLFHRRLYATVTRIPLIIRFPGGHYRGVQPGVVESIDLMPTLLEAVGAPVPVAVQGRSLLPMLEGRDSGPHLAFSESRFYGRRIAVAGNDLRLLLSVKREEIELYRYRVDPLEQDDLSGPKPRRGEFELKREAWRWNQLVISSRYPRQKLPEGDEAEKEQLRVLGYIQ